MGTNDLTSQVASLDPGHRKADFPGNGAPEREAEMPPLSEAVASEVHQLLNASEAAARAIREKAAAEAESLRRRLQQEAEQARRDAATRAQREVAKTVGEALQRLMEKAARLDASIAELRAEAGRLAVDLSNLDRNVASSANGASSESDDERRGRLIALTMAVNGASRGETARYLTENLNLRNPEALLDAAYG